MSDIHFENVKRIFTQNRTDVVAVDSVTFTIKDGEFVAIVGPSGCGKTTLLRIAAGLDFPTSGSVRVGNSVVRGPGPDRATVFQQFALFPWKTVRQNIEFGLKCARRSQEERAAAVHRYVELMGLKRPGGRLSAPTLREECSSAWPSRAVMLWSLTSF